MLVRLDVQHRRLIQQIDPGDFQRRTVDRQQPNDRQPDRVGVPGRGVEREAGCET